IFGISSHNTIAGLEILGGISSVGSFSILSYAGSRDDLEIKNCKFIPYSTTAVNYALGFTNLFPPLCENDPILIKNCEFVPGYSGIGYATSSGVNTSFVGLNFVIENCSFNGEEYAVAISSNSSKGLIKNCCFRNTASAITFIGMRLGAGSSIVSQNNCFDKVKTGILLSANITSSDVIVDSCVFKNLTTISGENAIIVTGTKATAYLQYSYFDSDKIIVLNGGKIVNAKLKGGDVTLTRSDIPIQLYSTDTYYQFIAPSGASINLTLPTGDAFSGMSFNIRNNNDKPENLNIYDSAALYDYLSQGQSREYSYDGANWILSHLGVNISSELALGIQSKANVRSIAVGYQASCVGDYNVAIGYQANTSTGDSSIAIGYRSGTSGDSSIAMGYIAEANGDNSVALGYRAHSYEDSVALGCSATVATSNVFSVALGKTAKVSADNSVALGGDSTLCYRNNEIKHSWDNSYKYHISDLVLKGTTTAALTWTPLATIAGDYDIIALSGTALGISLDLVCTETTTYAKGEHLTGTGMVLRDGNGTFTIVTTNLTLTEGNYGGGVSATMSAVGGSIRLYVYDQDYSEGNLDWVARLTMTEINN
ncbi:hypothetical protein KKF82_05905, partial [Patescibacteria group bacterium]|nr:hypothetical protein [Patescibacteria group bacterium]